jgi:hypothetical protein
VFNEDFYGANANAIQVVPAIDPNDIYDAPQG